MSITGRPQTEALRDVDVDRVATATGPIAPRKAARNAADRRVVRHVAKVVPLIAAYASPPHNASTWPAFDAAVGRPIVVAIDRVVAATVQALDREGRLVAIGSRTGDLP